MVYIRIAMILSVGSVLSQPDVNMKTWFRILAPQFICYDNKNTTENDDSSTTIIRLQTSPGQSLNYSCAVRFTVSKSFEDQRFVLSVWNSVRSIEKNLNIMRASISESNFIELNNSLFIPGVDYHFHITGAARNFLPGEETFIIRYSDETDKPTLDLGGYTNKIQMSVVMIAPETIYGDMEYVVEAQVTMCQPRSDYFFKWKVMSILEEVELKIPVQIGTRLQIDKGFMVGKNNYYISCIVCNKTDNTVITKNGIYMTVVSKGLSIVTNVDEIKVSTLSSIVVEARLENPDNYPGHPEFSWDCHSSAGSTCEGFQTVSNNTTIIINGFSTEGLYTLVVNVKVGINGVEKSIEINVENEALPVIEINLGQRLFNPGEVVVIEARVTNLQPGSELQWVPKQKDGFGSVAEMVLNTSKITINSLEETFLSELVEYSNETFQRGFNFIANDADLAYDVPYKFCLRVTCNCTRVKCSKALNKASVHSCVALTINSPPEVMPLKVEPLQGVGLKTKFVFSTNPAKDVIEDYPMRYRYGISMLSGDVLNVLSDLYDNLIMETILPYTDGPLIPTLTVCDARGACSTIKSEPIRTLRPIFSDDDFSNAVELFQSQMYRGEYMDAFNVAAMVLITLQELDEQNAFNSIKALMDNSTQAFIGNTLKKRLNVPKQFTSSLEIFMKYFEGEGLI